MSALKLFGKSRAKGYKLKNQLRRLQTSAEFGQRGHSQETNPILGVE